MGYQLRDMIAYGAPASWTPLMREVAKEIAADARDPKPGDDTVPWSALPITGGYWDRDGNWCPGLTERCGVSERAVSDALTRLGRAGYEMRQQIMKDGHPVYAKDGSPVFAAKGHALRFQIPPLPPRPTPQRAHPDAGFESQRAQSDVQRAQSDVQSTQRAAPPLSRSQRVSEGQNLLPRSARGRPATEDQHQGHVIKELITELEADPLDEVPAITRLIRSGWPPEAVRSAINGHRFENCCCTHRCAWCGRWFDPLGSDARERRTYCMETCEDAAFSDRMMDIVVEQEREQQDGKGP